MTALCGYKWTHWFTCPCPQRWHCQHQKRTVPSSLPIAWPGSLYVGDGWSSTLRWETMSVLGWLMGSWLLGQDSMHPLSWPCSVGVRNSFPSLCKMPVGFFPSAFESKVLGCSKGRAETPLREVSSRAFSPRAGLYLPGGSFTND